MLRAKESNIGIDVVFVPVGTVDVSRAVHCQETQRMNGRPVGTLEFPPEQGSSVLTKKLANALPDFQSRNISF